MSAMDTKHDSNNNSMEKAYSLRPRAAPRRSDQEAADQPDPWKPRCRTKKKTKQKSVPLSKYRRKTANARERFRMREINEAFEALRRVIPHLSSSCDNSNEKLTKISTLRFAMKYITALDNALQDPDFDSDGDSFFSEWTSTPSDIRESSTPSSVNDYSDIYEQFFSPSSSESSPSSSSQYGFSTLRTTPPCEFTPSSSNYSRLSVPPVYPTAPEFIVKDSVVKRAERVDSSSTQTPSFALTRCTLLSSSATHSVLEEDISHHLLSSDLPSCTSSLIDGLEEFSSPSVDLDDYLLT